MKKKLKLNDLKIQSFVTAVNKNLYGGEASGAACTVANSVKNGCEVSDYVRSLCRTCGIYCDPVE